jgi:hypothetical protein
VLDRVRRCAWGLSGRLIATYILVTLAVVVLVEGLVLGFQVPALVNGAQLQSQVDATATYWGHRLSQRATAGPVLGDPSQPTRPGQALPTLTGTLVVPAISGPIQSHLAVTAVVAVAADGTVVASSAPSRYPPGRAATSELPAPAAHSIGAAPTTKGQNTLATPYPTPYGTVLFNVSPVGPASAGKPSGQAAYIYVQAPWSPGFINPVRAWSELGQLGETGPLLQSAPSRCSSPSCRSACCSGCWPRGASSAGSAAWNEPRSGSQTATTPSRCPPPAATRSAGWRRTSPP